MMFCLSCSKPPIKPTKICGAEKHLKQATIYDNSSAFNGLWKSCVATRITFKCVLYILYTRSHKVVHSSYGLLHKQPWRWEVCTWQVWTKMFQRWGPFLKNMYLTLCQFSKKKSHPIRPVEGLKLCLDFLCNVRIGMGKLMGACVCLENCHGNFVIIVTWKKIMILSLSKCLST